MIKIFIGTLGSGKTLSMVKSMYEEIKKEKKKVISNLVLNFASNKISQEFFQSFADGKTQELYDVVLGLDEIHIFLDSRRSTSKKNVYLSYFLLQTRKRGVTLYATSQFINQVETRLRNIVDVVVKCQGFIKKGKKFEEVTPVMASDGLTKEQSDNLWILNTSINQSGTIIKREIFKASKYYSLYDTKQIISF